MKADTALRLLGKVMNWDDQQARAEFAWMSIMAQLKYDDYRDFLAGMRFLESLVAWLQQFESGDRAAAYEFVRHRLVYIGAAERQRMVELLYSNVIWPELVRATIKEVNVPSWRVLVDPDARAFMTRDRRATLFLALSDGARLDMFRHANARRISNEQVVVTVEPSKEKWADLLKELRKELKDENATFTRIVLVDDFTASGTSLIRLEDDGVWKGKLVRFLKTLDGQDAIHPDGVQLLVHHLIGTEQAREHITEHIAKFRAAKPDAWARVLGDVEPTYGLAYSNDIKLDDTTDAAFIALTEKYYDESIQTGHTDKGGVKKINLGYAGCRLPVVLDHNTPNNSVALLWAESEPSKCRGHVMRPLFRRRQRHS